MADWQMRCIFGFRHRRPVHVNHTIEDGSACIRVFLGGNLVRPSCEVGGEVTEPSGWGWLHSREHATVRY